MSMSQKCCDGVARITSQCFIHLFLLLACVPQEPEGVPIALLSGTLRTFQVHACDGEELKLECLENTVISIYLAQYGSNVPYNQLCPLKPSQLSNSNTSILMHSSPVSSHNTTSLLKNANVSSKSDCVSSENLRYSLLQTVEATCREQRVCKFLTSPQSFGGIDPCPGVKKYAEVAYKCIPNIFYNKVICEGDRLRLRCNKSLRIAIYSALFGATQTPVHECPELTSASPTSQTLSVSYQNECQVSYATEIVMSSCHGRRKCSIGADIDTFGNPGCRGRRLHLEVVYSCVPKDVLKDLLYLGGSQSDKSKGETPSGGSVEDNNENSDYTGFVEEARYVPELDTSKHHLSSTLSPPVHHIDSSVKMFPVQKQNMLSKIVESTRKTNFPNDARSIKTSVTSIVSVSSNDDQINCTLIIEPQRVIGFITEWISAINFIKRNTERFILYLLVSICVSLVTFLLVLSSRLYVQKRKIVQKVKKDTSYRSPFGALDDDMFDQFDGALPL